MSTYSEMVKENNRKVYAKRFKTSPSKISDKDIENIKKEDSKKSLKRMGGAYGLLGGGSMASKVHKSGKLDGVKKMSHITDANVVDKIKREGLKGTKIDEDNLTMSALKGQIATGHIKPEDLKDKVYLANNVNTEIGIKNGRKINGLGGKTGKVKVNIPLKDLKKVEVDNPELLGAKNLNEFKTRHREVTSKLRQMGNPFAQDAPDAVLKQVYKGLSRKGTTTVQGTVGTKYIKGSKDYQKNTVKNIAKHIKENPKMFAKGLGQAGVAGALMVGGGKLMYDGVKKSKLEDIRAKASKQEKKAYYMETIYGEAIEKQASTRNNKSRDKDTETKLMRDRVKPEISRKVRRLPLETLTDITIGAVAGQAGAKLGGKIGKTISKHSKKKAEIIGKGIGGAVIGGAATAPFKYQIKTKQEEKDYNKLSNKYLGRNINDKEKQAIRARNKKITLGYGSPVEGFKSTPEAMIQKARREKR